ncbi:MAG TPA: hypothetical protein DCX53_00745 [Anaerolineae bacterium]|nr:hypothetical protein [Anaerolineae bacterium]
MEVSMTTKKLFQAFVLLAVLLATFATTSTAFAAGCGFSVTVASGDTLRKIASRCGTTVAALTLANNLSNANLIHVGQILVLPGAHLHGSGYDIYVVAHGDTLKTIASRFGTTVDVLLKLNPSITNPNVIYAGQRLNVAVPTSPPPVVTPPPASGQIYYVRKGDTLRSIASRMSTTTEDILKVNPQIKNPSLIYVGQAITIPASASSYIVQKGDTLRIIANKFGTTVDNLLSLNPNIKNVNLIYVGQVINVR